MRWNLKEAGCGEPTNLRANLRSDGKKSYIRLYMREMCIRDRGKGKQRNKVAEIGLRPAGAVEIGRASCRERV